MSGTDMPSVAPGWASTSLPLSPRFRSCSFFIRSSKSSSSNEEAQQPPQHPLGPPQHLQSAPKASAQVQFYEIFFTASRMNGKHSRRLHHGSRMETRQIPGRCRHASHEDSCWPLTTTSKKSCVGVGRHNLWMRCKYC